MSDEYDYLDDVADIAHEPRWLVSRWHYDGTGSVLDEDGHLIAVVSSRDVADYIIATHHHCIDACYVGGQIEFDSVAVNRIMNPVSEL